MQPQDELENHGDVVKSILATVETMILPSLSATQFFQTNLFAFSPVRIMPVNCCLVLFRRCRKYPH